MTHETNVLRSEALYMAGAVTHKNDIEEHNELMTTDKMKLVSELRSLRSQVKVLQATETRRKHELSRLKQFLELELDA